MDHKALSNICCVTSEAQQRDLPPGNASRCSAIYCLIDTFLLHIGEASSISFFGLLTFISSLAWADYLLSHQAHSLSCSWTCRVKGACCHLQQPAPLPDGNCSLIMGETPVVQPWSGWQTLNLLWNSISEWKTSYPQLIYFYAASLLIPHIMKHG